MIKKKVNNIISSIYPISDKAFGEIEKLLVHEVYSKGDIIISKNKRNNKEYFSLKGITKSYLINSSGKEITLSFFIDNSIFTPHTIRSSKNFSTHYFKALTNVELASINAIAFNKLMNEHMEIRNFANTVLQKELKSKVKKEISLASLSAKERLKEFRQEYQLLENLISHSDIASFLGITNVSLSRLRNSSSN